MTRFSRYIVPFSFTHRYPDALRRAEGSGMWEMTSPRRGEMDLYSHITDLFEEPQEDASRSGEEEACGEETEKKHRIGALFSLNKARLPKELYWFPKKGDEAVPFRVADAGMSVFVSGLGFFWYEVETDGVPEDQLWLFHNRFKELAWDSNQRRFAEKDAEEGQFFYAGAWIAGLIGETFDSVRFIPERNRPKRMVCDFKLLPDKALLFHYASFEGTDSAGIRTHAWYMTNGYRDNYRMPDGALDRMYRPFEDAYWYVSAGGCGQFVQCTEDNREFYEGKSTFSMPSRMRSQYFLLYMLLLYQKYTLLQYAARMEQQFPADAASYRDSRVHERLTAFETEINAFLLKSVHATVSYVEHHNAFYRYAEARMFIRQDVESLTVGVDSLSRIGRIREEQAEKERDDAERKRDEKVQHALAGLSVLAVFSALTDSYSFFLEIGDIFTELHPVRIALIVFSFAVIAMIFILVLRAFISGIRSSKESDRQDGSGSGNR